MFDLQVVDFSKNTDNLRDVISLSFSIEGVGIKTYLIKSSGGYNRDVYTIGLLLAKYRVNVLNNPKYDKDSSSSMYLLKASSSLLLPIIGRSRLINLLNLTDKSDSIKAVLNVYSSNTKYSHLNYTRELFSCGKFKDSLLSVVEV